MIIYRELEEIVGKWFVQSRELFTCNAFTGFQLNASRAVGKEIYCLGHHFSRTLPSRRSGQSTRGTSGDGHKSLPEDLGQLPKHVITERKDYEPRVSSLETSWR